MAGYRSPLAGGRWHSPKQLDERVRESGRVMENLWENTLTGEVLDDFGFVIDEEDN